MRGCAAAMTSRAVISSAACKACLVLALVALNAVGLAYAALAPYKEDALAEGVAYEEAEKWAAASVHRTSKSSSSSSAQPLQHNKDKSATVAQWHAPTLRAHTSGAPLPPQASATQPQQQAEQESTQEQHWTGDEKHDALNDFEQHFVGNLQCDARYFDEELPRMAYAVASAEEIPLACDGRAEHGELRMFAAAAANESSAPTRGAGCRRADIVVSLLVYESVGHVRDLLENVFSYLPCERTAVVLHFNSATYSPAALPAAWRGGSASEANRAAAAGASSMAAAGTPPWRAWYWLLRLEAHRYIYINRAVRLPVSRSVSSIFFATLANFYYMRYVVGWRSDFTFIMQASNMVILLSSSVFIYFLLNKCRFSLTVWYLRYG